MLYLIHDHTSSFINLVTPAIKLALPFSDDKWSLPYDEIESNEEEEDSGGEDNAIENAGGLRISTRANVPYNLEGYSKNAMLLLSAKPQYLREGQVDPTILNKMATVSTSFSNFRFEIEQHLDLSDDEVEEKCQNFFRRDFSHYGCVAVVFLTVHGSKVEDSVVVRHWTNIGNPSLKDKPKLYIKEANHVSVIRRGLHRPLHITPITDNHPDALCLHLPSMYRSWRYTQPLDIFCSKLTTMADEHLMMIVKETLLEMRPMFRSMTFVATTQSRKLSLARSP